MRLLTGGSLDEHLKRYSGGPLPISEVQTLLHQLAGAFDYAHSQGVIHRDVKPANVMFDSHGTAYLVDFGIAKLLEATSSLTATGTVLGTVIYMAPEQWDVKRPITPATDQYALGVMTYLLVTGQAPFHAAFAAGYMHAHLYDTPVPPKVLNPDLPEEASAAILRTLAKTSEDRFPSVGAFVGTFNHAFSSDRTTTPRPERELELEPTFVAPKSAPPPTVNGADMPGTLLREPPRARRTGLWAWGMIVVLGVLACHCLAGTQ